MQKNILVYGLGAFGFAILRHLDRNPSTEDAQIFAYEIDRYVMSSLQDKRRHPFRYTDEEYSFSEKVNFVSEVEERLPQMDIIILAVPSQFLLDVLAKIGPKLSNDVILLNAAKALSPNGKLFSQEFEAAGIDCANYAIISGGMIAAQFFQGYPLGCTIASCDPNTQKTLQTLLQSETLFVETSDDVRGVECAGAFKNVAAILLGWLEGQGYPYGTMTLYLARYTAEIQAFAAEVFGADPATFSASSQCRGNDFFMSCTGNTRNSAFGKLLGQGQSFVEALATMTQQKKTIEGAKTLAVLATKLKNTTPGQYPLLEKCLSFVEDNFGL